MIIRSRVVVPMEGEPIENGAVAIERNQIVSVGRFPEVKANHVGEMLDLGEQILLPGLINAHCHLDYTMLRGAIPPPGSFTDWVRAINAAKAGLQEEDYLAAIEEGFAEAMSFGTTTLVNLEAFPELLPRMPRSPLRTWWCAEMIDVRGPRRANAVADDLAGWLRSRPGSLGGMGLAPHAPFTASAPLYSEATALSRKHDLLLTTHLAESHEEMQLFRDAKGPLFEFLKSIGRPMNDCGNSTPVSHLIATQEIDERWIVAHLNELTESDFELLARTGRFHVVHCPRSHTFFRHAPFAMRKLRALGFNICLGTDSLASNSSLSLFAEMRELLRKEPWLSPREVLEMATVNGARAIGQPYSLGRIHPGSSADLIAIPGRETGTDIFADIIAFEGSVPWKMVNGEATRLHG